MAISELIVSYSRTSFAFDDVIVTFSVNKHEGQCKLETLLKNGTENKNKMQLNCRWE